MAETETKVDQDRIREVMVALGDLLLDLSLRHKDQLGEGGWARVQEEIYGSGVIATAVRNPLSTQSLKTIDSYLQQLGVEAKALLARRPDSEAAQKVWTAVKEAYDEVKQSVQSDAIGRTPVQQLQIWLRALNLYVVPTGQIDPKTKRPIFMHGAITGKMDAPTINALQSFRKQCGLPTNVQLNDRDMATLQKLTQGA